MNKFTIGNLVKTMLGEGIITKTGLRASSEPYSIILYTKIFNPINGYMNKDEYSCYDKNIELFISLSKEEQLLQKMKQLYERQAWVKERV